MIKEKHLEPSVPLFRDDAEYERFRQRLIFYFERRGCLAPDILADECFKRLAASVQSTGLPDQVATFLFGIARNVYLEHMRDAVRLSEPLCDDLQIASEPPSAHESGLIAKHVVDSLSPEDRELMEAHFFDKLSWKSLARRSGQTDVALRLKVMRIRDRLMRQYGDQLKSLRLKRKGSKRSGKGEGG